MSKGVKVRVWGDYALFTRPEMKVERCSYDVITPSAARGILEAVYWHPGMRWVIDRIYVKKPIQFTSIRRNEVKSKISAANVLSVYNGNQRDLSISSKAEIVQRASLLLRDVEYVIDPQRLRPSKSEVFRLCGDNTKITGLTQWRPQVTLREGLARTIEWFTDSDNLSRYKSDIYNR